MTVPKCLVSINGKPLLDFWLDHLFTAGFGRALVNTHWLHEKVETHVAASKWRDRVDLVFEPELLGTGGTIVANRDWLGEGPYLLAHADNLTDFDVAAFCCRHQARPPTCAITMLAFRTDTPQTCGILEISGDGTVERFHEKVEYPPGNLANAAVYICEPEVTAYMASLQRPFVDFSTEVIPHFMGRILAVETAGYHRDIGSPEALAAAIAEYAVRHQNESAAERKAT